MFNFAGENLLLTIIIFGLMKNRFLLSIVLMLLCISAARAEVVTLGSGTNTNTALPFPANWKYNFTQQIYTSTEIGTTGSITSIAFYAESSSSSTHIRNLNVYMSLTDKSSFSSAADWETVSESNKVFSGNVEFNMERWNVITLDTPFQYNGTKNLCITINDVTGSYLSAIQWRVYNDGSKSIAWYNDNEAYDVTALSSATGSGSKTTFDYKSQVQLTFSGGGSSDVIEIGSGTETSNLLPTDNYYNYSLTQQIYTKSEIGGSKTLRSISFLNASQYERTRNLDIYLIHTDKEAFADGSGWIDCSGAQKVFSGEVMFFVGEWTTIVFDTPFEYNGTDNLAVIVDDNSGYYTINTPFYTFDASGQAMNAHSDNTNYDVARISEYSGNRQDKKNQIKFNAAPNRRRPTNLQITELTYYTVTITWEGEGRKWNVQCFNLDKDELWGESRATSLKQWGWVGLNENTRHMIRVQEHLGGSEMAEDGWRYIYFTTPERYPRPTDLAVSEITAHTAVLKWTENSGATSWQIELDGATTYEISGEPEFLLEGLSANADHTVKVRSIIDKSEDIYSNWSDSEEFHTAQANPIPTDIVVTPYETSADITWTGTSESYAVKYRKSNAIFFDDFENGLGKWTIYTQGEAQEVGWYINGFKAYNGNFAARADSWKDNTAYQADNWLITPALDLGGTLKFWVSCYSASYPDQYEVLLSKTGNATEDFTTVLQPMQSSTLDWSEVVIDLSSYAGQRGYIAIHHQDYDKMSLFIDDFGVYSASEASWSTVYTTEPKVTLNGLNPETWYDYQIIGYYEGEPDAETEISSFTTKAINRTPTDVAVTPSGTSATISWEGSCDSYKVRYIVVPEPEPYATIILRTDDVWGDGTGYQMLIDADADTYGTIIPTSNGLTTSGDADPSVYAEFEYKIPENADGAMNTSNVIINSQASIKIPAGTYDWCITNPTPGDRIWIASQGGNVGGRYDDYVFEAGKTYEFYVHSGGSNDATDVSITEPYDWDEAITIDDATSPLIIEGLEQETTYVVQVIGIKDGEEYASDVTTFTTLPPSAPTDIAVTPGSTSATVSWSGTTDSYKVKYRTSAQKVPSGETFFEGFEGLDDKAMPDGWSVIDADGDGYGWCSDYSIRDVISEGVKNFNIYSGSGIMTSASYINNIGSLTPDNWLITPKVTLGKAVTAWLVGQDPSWCRESFAFYVSTTGTNPEDFTQVSPEYVASGEYAEYTADLSAYAGQEGFIAIRHFDVTDMYWLNIDDFRIFADYEVILPAGEWQTIETTDTEVMITGLDPATTYECQVIGISDDVEYASDIAPFTTNPLLVMDAYADNNDLINDYHGKTVDVTLSSRTYRKDGTWQTICLPFDVELADSPLEGAEARTTEHANVEDNILIIDCLTPVTKIEAGIPYIIRWNSGEDIVDPTFTNVVIDANGHPIYLYDDDVAFLCIYSYFATSPDPTYSSYYYVAGSPALVSMANGCELLAFDAYIGVSQTLNETLQGVAINTGDMSIEDLIATGIRGIGNSQQSTDDVPIYNVAGQRLSKKQKGVNIVNGKKVAIK